MKNDRLVYIKLYNKKQPIYVYFPEKNFYIIHPQNKIKYNGFTKYKFTYIHQKYSKSYYHEYLNIRSITINTYEFQLELRRILTSC